MSLTIGSKKDISTPSKENIGIGVCASVSIASTIFIAILVSEMTVHKLNLSPSSVSILLGVSLTTTVISTIGLVMLMGRDKEKEQESRKQSSAYVNQTIQTP